MRVQPIGAGCLRKRRGQTAAEYAIAVAVIAGSVTAMHVFVKRRIQAVVKVSADAISPYGIEHDPDGKKAQLDGLKYESGDRGGGNDVLVQESVTRDVTSKSETTRQLRGGAYVHDVAKDTSISQGALAGRGAGVSAYSEVVVRRNKASGEDPPRRPLP